ASLGGLLITHQYFGSPYKKELLKIKTEDGLKLITDFSLVMQFLERELEGLGLIVFKPEVEGEVRRMVSEVK
ncbi:MAG: hypothetical protein QXW75_00005, partial [Thermoplasmatales archaeon]